MIPFELQQDMASDPYYQKCAFTGTMWGVQWHHVFIFGGKDIQEKWAIVPIARKIHEQCTPNNSRYTKELAERVELIALNRAKDEELKKYSKVKDLIAYREQLREKYGINNFSR